MEELTKAINSSSHSRLFTMQWNRDKDKREVAKGNEHNFYCNHMTTEKLKAVQAVRRNQGFQLQRYSKWKEEFDISGEENHHNINKVVA
jgi:hypothetical protein